MKSFQADSKHTMNKQKCNFTAVLSAVTIATIMSFLGQFALIGCGPTNYVEEYGVANSDEPYKGKIRVSLQLMSLPDVNSSEKSENSLGGDAEFVYLATAVPFDVNAVTYCVEDCKSPVQASSAQSSGASSSPSESTTGQVSKPSQTLKLSESDSGNGADAAGSGGSDTSGVLMSTYLNATFLSTISIPNKKKFYLVPIKSSSFSEKKEITIHIRAVDQKNQLDSRSIQITKE